MSNRQPKVNAEMLAAAVCKLEGFTYAPNADQLQALSDEVGENRSLLMCCAAYRGGADRFRNLTLKKIPKIVLTKCEWGHDDYSLIVQNLPMAVPSPAESSSTANSGRAAKVANPAQGGLFAGENA
jgi:adenine-specific DNA-methyltransferase